MIEWYAIVKTFSYFGIFLASLISSSTIFLPMPIYALIILASTTLGMNPFLVALSAAIGMSLGELTSYFMGLGGNVIFHKKKFIKSFNKFFKKYGFISIAITAFLPFPFDIVGILAGMGRYEIKKFLIATFIGKFFKSLLISLVGYGIREIVYWVY
ncbi:MAG: YqaA family protein [Candidatus Aenigmatarchaeota archaeon]|jgi:membrane protein YqaA with SNARE-associated domain